MWSLERPAHSARSSFTTCISRVRNPALAARLAAATPTIVAASADFANAAQRARLDEIHPHEIVVPDVTVGEMEKVYTQRMAKSGAPGRDIYDEIFTSSPAGRCPLCTQRPVGALDHHLPKAHFPSLAVAPLNLVPACSDCNKAKLDAVPRSPDEVPLHPYFDDLGEDRWLLAVVVERRPAALRFRVSPPDDWSDNLSARVRHHFRTLGLGALFTSEAAEELVNIRHQLALLHDAVIEHAVRDELRRRSVSCAAGRPNGWRAAAYTAWSESAWFCVGGFLPA